MITPRYLQIFSADNCVVCSCSIYSFWLPPVIYRLFLLTIMLSVRALFTASGNNRGQSEAVYRRRTDNTIVNRKSLEITDVVCSCSIYSFWLPPVISRLFLLTIMLSVRALFTASNTNRQHNCQQKKCGDNGGQSEAVNRKRRDNTIVNRKSLEITKGNQKL
jgi:uncharacterized membrane protein YbaN (DUF454 family)